MPVFNDNLGENGNKRQNNVVSTSFIMFKKNIYRNLSQNQTRFMIDCAHHTPDINVASWPEYGPEALFIPLEGCIVHGIPIVGEYVLILQMVPFVSAL